jgi:FlaG/FlaF family flagellin (archaellin)
MNLIQKRTEQRDSAVSPVVGVMLMLVVTIIIAAVVATFAGGLLTTTEQAPTAVLTATVDTTWSNYGTYNGTSYGGNGTVFVSSLNGDPIDLSKLAVKVYNATTSYTYSPLDQGLVTGTKLESGETLNVVYAVTSNYPGDEFLNDVLTINTGEYVEVVIVYNDQTVLYDKEVTAL